LSNAIPTFCRIIATASARRLLTPIRFAEVPASSVDCCFPVGSMTLEGEKYVVVVVITTGGRHWIVKAYLARRWPREESNGAKLSFQYDRDADIL